jgi:hypothetical protein
MPMSILAQDLLFLKDIDMLGAVHYTDAMTFAVQPRIF